MAKAFIGGNGKDCAEFGKIAKTIVLCLSYVRSEYSIHEELTGKGPLISLDEVRSFSARYNAMFKGIFKWRQASVVRS
jgi:hypothetical protein